MSLPNLGAEFSFVKIKLPSGKTIGVRGWKVKDEKDLLFSMESDANAEEKKINYYVSFLKKCTDNEKTYDSLGEQDLKKIAIEIRKLSKGDAIEYNYQCPHCQHKLFTEVSLTKAEVTKNFDSSPTIVNDNTVITFKEISFKKLDELYEKHKDSRGKFLYHVLLNSIESITFKGETHTNFTPEEVETSFDTLESNDLKKITDAFTEKQSNVDLQQKLICLKCTKEIEVNFGDVFSFLIL